MSSNSTSNSSRVAIIGGGVSGTSLLYLLARCTNIASIDLFEKYDHLAPLNSASWANSQTLHFGDLETHYTLDKSKIVKQGSSMILDYLLKYPEEKGLAEPCQKMVIGVGEEEVQKLSERYEKIKGLYTYLQRIDKAEIAKLEPAIIETATGERKEAMQAHFSPKGKMVNFGNLTRSFAKQAEKYAPNRVTIHLNKQVVSITQKESTYILEAGGKKIEVDYVVSNAGVHSLFLAKKMGYGADLSTLPIAGRFYYTKPSILRGKVYTMQNPKLPFAALHGDPDVAVKGITRFGPTALLFPLLERYHGVSSFGEFIQSLSFDRAVYDTMVEFWSDREVFSYLMKNIGFEIPFLGKQAFLNDIRKIVPKLRYSDLKLAKHTGGIRPQAVSKKTKKFLFGEICIDEGKGIVFNMTPSPGASSCLNNALQDTRKAVEYLHATFDEEALQKDFPRRFEE